MKLLHIDASPRGDRSRSRVVADGFIAALGEHRPGLAVTRIDLWSEPLPDLGAGMIEGRYNLIMGEAVEPAIAGAWDEVRAVAERFLSFDAYLVSTPMWNFGVPYRLKHYVDIVTQPGMTFTNDVQGNVIGLAAGRKAMLVGASALPIGVDGVMAEFDFQIAYLEAWLRFIGVVDIEIVRAAPTFGAPEDVASTMEAACRRAEVIAASF